MIRTDEKLNVINDQNLNQFINVDQNLPTENDDFENQIIALTQHNGNSETDDETEDVLNEDKIKCYDEALNYIHFSTDDYMAIEVSGMPFLEVSYERTAKEALNHFKIYSKCS